VVNRCGVVPVSPGLLGVGLLVQILDVDAVLVWGSWCVLGVW